MSRSVARVSGRFLAILLTLTLATPLLSARCEAEQLDARAVLDDPRLYFTAPLRWDAQDWMYAAGTVLAIGVAHEYDDNVRAHFADGPHATPGGTDPHSRRDFVPTAAVVGLTLAFATLLDDSAGYQETGSMVEAAAFTAVSNTVIKLAAGRMRPNDTTKVDDWSGGGNSFPSLHASVAFAVGTVLAESGGEDYRWVRRTLGYSIAAATTYVRVRDNVHWTSDVAGGAALGIATAHFVMNRRDRHSPSSALTLESADGGVMLTYTRTLR